MTKSKQKNTSKEFSNKKKELNSLVNKRKSLEIKLKNCKNNIEIIETKKITDTALNRLPIESLKELYSPPESITDHLNKHSEERKKYALYLEEIDKIDRKIKEIKIDLTIEKINLVLKDLN